MSEYFYLATYKSFAFFLKTLPERWLDGIIKALAHFAYRASKKRRHVIHANLDLCFPQMPESEKKSYRHTLLPKPPLRHRQLYKRR